MNDEFGPNFVTLTDDEGNDIELESVDALEHNGTTYMAFFPVVEEDSEDEENEEEYGLVILKSQMENGEEFLVTIDDEGLRPLHGADPFRRRVKLRLRRIFSEN